MSPRTVTISLAAFVIALACVGEARGATEVIIDVCARGLDTTAERISVNRKAIDILEFITRSHPVYQDAVSAASGNAEAFELVFSSIGYALPPRPAPYGYFAKNPGVKFFKRSMIPTRDYDLMFEELMNARGFDVAKMALVHRVLGNLLAYGEAIRFIKPNVNATVSFEVRLHSKDSTQIRVAVWDPSWQAALPELSVMLRGLKDRAVFDLVANS